MGVPPEPAPEPAAPTGGPIAGKPRSMTRRMAEVFFENKLGVLGLAILVVMVGFCFLGPLFYHTDQIHTNIDIVTLTPGSPSHPLGTDDDGYDELGRLMVAGQSSLEVGVAAGLIASIIGTLYGAIAGYFGGWVDALMMRILDAAYSLPSIFILLYLAATVGRSKLTLILVIGLTLWLLLPRLVRGETLTLKTREYVQAVRVMGGGTNRIIYRHILPNAIGTIVVSVTFIIADAIFALSTLSFIGLGLEAPQIDWGGMLNTGTSYVFDGYWWLVFPPGVAIILVIIAFNFIGDALRDAFETRLQKR
jgi:peptide/nickel transport system permease protein